MDTTRTHIGWSFGVHMCSTEHGLLVNLFTLQSHGMWDLCCLTMNFAICVWNSQGYYSAMRM